MKIVTILAAAVLACAALPAHAGVCTKEIAAVSKLLSGDFSGAAAAAMPSTSTAGAMSAVTGGGGTNAPSAAAVEQASGAVEQAKTADAAGDETSCMDYINQAKQLLGLIQ
jgi:hypothetical protein